MSKTNKKWIVPPGLRSNINDFEDLYDVAEDRHLMICGPSGVGKSLFLDIFKTLYKRDNGNDKPIHRFNCAAFTKELLLSELFGHEKGAFTGANAAKEGHIKKADGGVLFLEEIGDIPETGQAQLLTFIEDGIFYKVGSIKPETAKVRIVATTNKAETLRLDFSHRFIPFKVSPLHKRRGDILYYLFFMFSELSGTLQKWEALLLLAHNWPGNVREIERIGTMFRWQRKKNSRYEILPNEKYSLETSLAYFAFKEEGYVALSFLSLLDFRHRFEDEGRLNEVEKKLRKFGLSMKIKAGQNDPFLQKKTYTYGSDKDFDSRYRDINVHTHSHFEEIDRAEKGLWLLKDSVFNHSEFDNINLLESPGTNVLPDISTMTEKQLLKFYYDTLLKKHGGNKARAARAAGLNYRTFQSRLKKDYI